MKQFLPVLRRCPLFAGLNESEISRALICMGARERRYRQGAAILSEGDAAEQLGIVLSGCVQVVREDYYGNRSIMAKLTAGQLFAEAFACAGGMPLPVNVLADEAAVILLVDAQRLTRTCSNACAFHTRLIYNLMKILAVKNLICQEKIEVTSRRTTREKLLAYLMICAKKAQSSRFTIPFDRQELADYLEVDRSGLSTEIGKLRKEGVIRCDRSHFELLKE